MKDNEQEEGMESERFTLEQRKDWFVIHREVYDEDVDIWVRVEELARLRSREDARRFMEARPS